MTTDAPLILGLNDDCLWTIFSYLTLQDLLQAEKVCRRFNKIAQMHYKRYRDVDLTERGKYFNNFTPSWRVKYINEPIAVRVGPYVEALVISYSFDPCRDPPISVLKYFQNLQYICLLDCNFTNETCIETLSEILPALKYIELIPYRSREDLLANWFKKSPKLEVLKIKQNPDVGDFTGDCLVALTGIKELTINGFIKFNLKYFLEFCKINPQLNTLSVDNVLYDNYDEHTFQNIAENLKNLENLTFQENSELNYTMFSNLSKLKRLRINQGICGFGSNNQLDDFLKKNARKNHIECLNIQYMGQSFESLDHFKQLNVLILNIGTKYCCSRLSYLLPKLSCKMTLKELHLLTDQKELPSADLKDLIQNLKSLKLINFWSCTNFDIKFLLDIEDCLHNRNQMMEFIVNGTPIEKEFHIKENDEFPRFIERTKGKVKFTIKAERSFYEWEEWETKCYNI